MDEHVRQLYSFTLARPGSTVEGMKEEKLAVPAFPVAQRVRLGWCETHCRRKCLGDLGKRSRAFNKA